MSQVVPRIFPDDPCSPVKTYTTPSQYSLLGIQY
jgi:hypothetical protein